MAAQNDSDPRINDLRQQVVTLVENNELKTALGKSKELLELTNRHQGEESTHSALSYSDIGIIQYKLKQFSAASVSLRRSLDIREKLDDTPALELIELYRLHADSLASDNKREASHSAYIELIKILDKHDLSESRQAYDIYFGAARNAGLIKKFEESNELFIKTLKLSGSHFAPLGGERRNLNLVRLCTVARFKENEKLNELYKQVAKELSDKENADRKIVNGEATSLPVPEYPLSAKQRRLKGTVYVSVDINEEGRVTDAFVVCSDPELGGAAIVAARRARFSPTTVDGVAVKTSGLLTYNFVL